VAPRITSDRLERLTNLVLVLLHTNRPLPLREIAATVAGYPEDPVALRQAFERDKRVLRENGIPLTMERPEGADYQVGYRILPEHYYLPDLDLTADEQLALGFALAAVRIEGEGSARDAFGKLGLPDVPDLPPVAVLPSLPALGTLQDAVRRRCRVSFTYRGRLREVESYGLCFRSGAWYLVGRDATVPNGQARAAAGGGAGGGVGGGDDLRTFRVDRIEGEVVAATAGSYEPPADLDLRELVRFVPWQSHGAEATEVVVDVDSREARAALDLAGPGAAEARPEGHGVRLRFAVGDEEAFVSWLVGLGDAAVLVSPDSLRQRVVRRLEEITAGVR
jgi:proteasome accessory factor B